MAKRLFWSLGALAGSAIAQEPSITTPPHALLPRATASANTACDLASSAASAYLAAEPSAKAVVIPADLAYNCMRSVPNYQAPAISLLNSLRTYIEFQSSIEYLQNPPSGYLLPAVDLITEFDDIQKRVENGTYESEYDFQVDVVSMFNSAHDGHFSWNGDLIGAFTFVRLAGNGLAAVSSDGQDVPQVYVADDLVQADPDTGIVGPVTGYSPSPITNIDGVDMVTFLLTQSLVARWQDPDALWNQLFLSPYSPADPVFQVPTFYPALQPTSLLPTELRKSMRTSLLSIYL